MRDFFFNFKMTDNEKEQPLAYRGKLLLSPSSKIVHGLYNKKININLYININLENKYKLLPMFEEHQI